jgi:hypothetical protein
VVKVHYPDGEEQLALLIETIEEPTARLLDTDGQEFMALLRDCHGATTDGIWLYWKLRSPHTSAPSTDVENQSVLKSNN